MKRVSRIAIKFSAIVSIVILVIMPIMASLVLRQTRSSLIKEMEIRAEFFARSVRESLFPQPDAFSLYFSVTEMIKEKAILYAMVFDEKGEIISHSDTAKIGEKAEAIAGNETVVKREEDLYRVSVPIIVGDKFVGGVRIGFSQESISTALVEMRNKIILITLGVLAFSILATVIVVTFMVSPINTLAGIARRIGKGDLEQKVEMKRKDELGELGNTFNEMVKGLKDRDFIRNTFGKYVSKQVAEAILNGRLQLGGERKRATVLISDVRNFTAMSEKLPPEEVVDFLNEYFSEMVSVVTKYEGTLDKFIGDALLAVFGAPIAHQDDARKAVFAALEMQEKLKEFNKKRAKKGKSEIRIGIAVHTGNLVAGNIGSEVRMEYTVIGDTVNLTSRLEPLNKQFGTQILISESTYSEVKDDIEVREIPDVELRGKEQKVKVYDVLGKKSKFTPPAS
ncbi:HAMP domain-containing protein [bacterium]|nr:HAMP domain-containing protein [bacterium]NIN92038.1 HAMP domain-containing protein [bacterium]NIO18254.1 HAMP domain-containing protein [bacterium]NIO73228.1 HAMP domain-containing protein [bacterium]